MIVNNHFVGVDTLLAKPYFHLVIFIGRQHYAGGSCRSGKEMVPDSKLSEAELVRMAPYLLFRNAKSAQQAFKEHHQILDAIAARDGELAELPMHQHNCSIQTL